MLLTRAFEGYHRFVIGACVLLSAAVWYRRWSGDPIVAVGRGEMIVLAIMVLIAGLIMSRRLRAGSPTLLTFGHKRHSLRDDFVLAALLTVFGFPSSLLQPSLDDCAVSLTEILPSMFRLLAEHHDIDKTNFFLQILALLEPSAHSKAKARYRRPARCVPQLGIPREIPQENNFIKSGHRRTPVPRLPVDAAPPRASHDEPSET